MDFRAYTLNKPVSVPDCNRCKCLNMTEQEQRRDKKELFGHICLGYDKRVRHNGEEVRLYPCKECERDEYKGFRPREEVTIDPQAKEKAKEYFI